jgi:hypothetical protein
MLGALYRDEAEPRHQDRRNNTARPSAWPTPVRQGLCPCTPALARME